MMKNRKGFSLITAIILILVIGSIGALVMTLSGKMVQETTFQYKKEQSILYAKSYTGLAILAAISNNCVKDIKSKEGAGKNTYDIEIKITYIGNEINAIAGCSGAASLGSGINHINSRGNAIIIDAFVSYLDPFSKSSRKIKYYRRTIQKL